MSQYVVELALHNIPPKILTENDMKKTMLLNYLLERAKASINWLVKAKGAPSGGLRKTTITHRDKKNRDKN